MTKMKSGSVISDPLDFTSIPTIKEEEQNSWLLVSCLWLFSSIFSASNIEFSSNVTGNEFNLIK